MVRVGARSRAMLRVRVRVRMRVSDGEVQKRDTRREPLLIFASCAAVKTLYILCSKLESKALLQTVRLTKALRLQLSLYLSFTLPMFLTSP
jgi:hypothetical protein